MNPESARSLLFRHIEKICVAAVAVIVIAYAINLAAGASEAAQLKQEVDEKISRIKNSIRIAKTPPEIDVDYAARARAEFLRVPETGAEPSWFAFKRPFVLRRAIFRKPPRPLHFPPTLETAVDIGQALLKWSDSENNENIEILRYELYRKEENGAWGKITELPRKAENYLDKGLEHEESYFYKLRSIARPISGATDFGKPDDGFKDSLERKIETPFNFDIKVFTWSPGMIEGHIIVKKPGDKIESKKFSWHEGSKIVIGDRDTGWTVEKIGKKSVTIKKNKKVKTFSK